MASRSCPATATAHFGLVLNVDDPKACEAGYEGTTKVDPHRTTGLPPVNLDAHCAASRGSGVNVRGAQNAPKPTRGGQSGQSYPMAFGATPVALGNRAVTSGSPVVVDSAVAGRTGRWRRTDRQRHELALDDAGGAPLAGDGRKPPQ